MAGPAKRVKTFVSTIHSMGLLPVKQTAPAATLQLQPQPDSVCATGYGKFTEQQHLSSVSSTPVASRLLLSAALEQPSAAERHTAMPSSALQHVHDHQVAVHTHTQHTPCACLLQRLPSLPGPCQSRTSSLCQLLLLLGLHALGFGIT